MRARHLVPVLVACLLAPCLCAQTVGEALAQATRKKPSDPAARDDIFGTDIDRSEWLKLYELDWKAGDVLTYDVTAVLRVPRVEDGKPVSQLMTMTGQLVLTVDEVLKDGFIVSWPDVVFREHRHRFEAGRVFVSKNGRIRAKDEDYSRVILDLFPMIALPPSGYDLYDHNDYALSFRVGTFESAKGIGRVARSVNDESHIAAYGRTYFRMSWEIHTVFDEKRRLIVSGKFENISLDLSTAIVLKDVKRKG